MPLASCSVLFICLPSMPPRPVLTHFLCLPLINAGSRPSFEALEQHINQRVVASPELAKLAGTRSVRPIGSIHLTLGVMSLETPERVDEAIRFLRQLDVPSLLPKGTPSLSTSVVGLEARHPAQNTSVLWIPFHDAQLQTFCDQVRHAFQDAGLVIQEDRPLLLHATVLNTIYARQKGRSGRGGPARIDARKLVNELDQHVWADSIELDRIALCKMGAKQVTDDAGRVLDEAYEELAVRAISLQ